MTTPSQDIWGPPLAEYLSRPEANFLFSELPSEAAITDAIDNILSNPAVVTYRTMESAVAVVYRPALLKRFTTKNSITACMNILETYVGRNGLRNNSILEHAYGFLGIHVLSLVLQAGLMHSIDYGLDRLPRTLDLHMRSECELKAPALTTQYIQKFVDYFGDEMDMIIGFRTGSTWMIEWCKDTHGNTRACLPAIGGFKYQNAEYVIGQLYGARAAFLECGYRTGTHGWALLVFITQCLLDDKIRGTSQKPDLWQKQHFIARRYSLIAGPRAHKFMEFVCGRYAVMLYGKFHGAPDVVDSKDAQLIQRAYENQFQPNKTGTHKKLDLSYMTATTDYAWECIFRHSPRRVHFIKTTLAISWDIISCMGNEADERWEVIDIYMGKCFYQATDILDKRPELAPELILLLCRVDIMGMIGRYLLIPAYMRTHGLREGHFTNPKFTISKQGLTTIEALGYHIGRTVQQDEASLPAVEDLYPDWSKTWLLLQQLKVRYPRKSLLYAECIKSEEAWEKLGRDLGFAEYLKPDASQRRCIYARCADPDDARFQSNGERYCSKRCQQASQFYADVVV